MKKTILVLVLAVASPLIAEKIISYKAVCGYDEDSVTSEVNNMIGGGWQPFGALSISAFDKKDGFTIYHRRQTCQGMVKYEPTPKPTATPRPTATETPTAVPEAVSSTAK
jgi:hypothetical protein